jgi:ABC-type transporter Mla MlaB component
MTGDAGQLALTGPQTLRTIDAAHAALLEMGMRHPMLEIDCQAVDEVDLSFIQLLLAARKSAAMAGRTIRIAPPATGALLQALERSGVLGAQTGGDAAERRFWLDQEIA